MGSVPEGCGFPPKLARVTVREKNRLDFSGGVAGFDFNSRAFGPGSSARWLSGEQQLEDSTLIAILIRIYIFHMECMRPQQ